MSQRVLVIEDEETLHILYKRFLRASSTELDFATTLDGALSQLEEQHYDAIVTDLKLTQSSRHEGLQIIRFAKESGLTCPIILTTGIDDQEVVTEARSLGVLSVLNKPFFRKDFKDALAAHGIAIDDLVPPA